MFRFNIDNEISLSLIHEQFSARYVELVSECNEYLSEWLAWPRLCKTQGDFKAFIRQSLHKYADGKNITFAILYHGEIVGNISFNTIDHELKKVEIGYWIGEKHQGNGIITRSCQFLIDYAFTTLKMQKVQISAAEHNEPSRAVCERLGMKLEGVITHSEKIGGKVLSHAIYGLHRNKD